MGGFFLCLKSLELLDAFDEAFADLDSFLVLGNEVPVALGQGVLQTLMDVLLVDDGFELQEAAEEQVKPSYQLRIPLFAHQKSVPCIYLICTHIKYLPYPENRHP